MFIRLSARHPVAGKCVLSCLCTILAISGGTKLARAADIRHAPAPPCAVRRVGPSVRLQRWAKARPNSCRDVLRWKVLCSCWRPHGSRPKALAQLLNIAVAQHVYWRREQIKIGLSPLEQNRRFHLCIAGMTGSYAYFARIQNCSTSNPVGYQRACCGVVG